MTEFIGLDDIIQEELEELLDEGLWDECAASKRSDRWVVRTAAVCLMLVSAATGELVLHTGHHSMESRPPMSAAWDEGSEPALTEVTLGARDAAKVSELLENPAAANSFLREAMSMARAAQSA